MIKKVNFMLCKFYYHKKKITLFWNQISLSFTWISIQVNLNIKSNLPYFIFWNMVTSVFNFSSHFNLRSLGGQKVWDRRDPFVHQVDQFVPPWSHVPCETSQVLSCVNRHLEMSGACLGLLTGNGPPEVQIHMEAGLWVHWQEGRKIQKLRLCIS